MQTTADHNDIRLGIRKLSERLAASAETDQLRCLLDEIREARNQLGLLEARLGSQVGTTGRPATQPGLDASTTDLAAVAARPNGTPATPQPVHPSLAVAPRASGEPGPIDLLDFLSPADDAPVPEPLPPHPASYPDPILDVLRAVLPPGPVLLLDPGWSNCLEF